MAQNHELDDKSINDDTYLLRRITAPNHYKEDKSFPTGFRVTSAAFKNDRINNADGDRLSVVIEDKTPHSHEEIVLIKSKKHGLISLTAGIVRIQGQLVVHSASTEEPGHGDVIGAKPRKIRRAFAASCTVLIEPGSLSK